MSRKERQLIFRCTYCGKETKLVVRAEQPIAMQSKPVSIVRYCEHCNRPNKIEMPDNLGTLVFILGKTKGFLGHSQENIPILQGEEDK